MIHYHGGPITPESAAVKIWKGRHGLISFAYPEQIPLVAEVCQSFVLDNGAFSVWKSGHKLDYDGYVQWTELWSKHPGFDWALIPDSIEGNENENDELISRWPQKAVYGVPVWHLHESLSRLYKLSDEFRTVAIGSSGQWKTPGTQKWWGRIAEIMNDFCNIDGKPPCKLHGLRMLNPKIFGFLPLASADSSMVAVNIGLDTRWKGTFTPPNKATRGIILAERIESVQSSCCWKKGQVQMEAF